MINKIGRTQRWKRAKTAHFILRAKEHYGLDLTEADVLEINQKLWHGEAIEFSKQKRKGKKYFVELPRYGGCLPIIYHTGRHRVITVLPPDAAEVVRTLQKLAQIRLIEPPLINWWKKLACLLFSMIHRVRH